MRDYRVLAEGRIDGVAVTDTLAGAPPLSPLYRMAILKGAEASVLLHLRRGAPLEARDDRGRTPLHLAAGAGRMATCRLLLTEGADRQTQDAEGQTAAALAQKAGYPDIASLLAPAEPPPPRGVARIAPDPVIPSHPGPAVSLTEPPGLPEPEDEGGGWEAEDTPETVLSDTTLTVTVTTVQAAISEHRAVSVRDAWGEAEIRIPQPARPGRPRVDLPEGATPLFALALRQGWTDVDQIGLDLADASPEVRRIAAAALELSGVRIDPSSIWTRSAAGRISRRPALSRTPGLEDALALFADLLTEAADPLEIYAATLLRAAAPDRDEESRLFQSLSDARTALLAVVGRHRMELSGWLDRALAGLEPDAGDESPEAGDEMEDSGVEGLVEADLEPLRALLVEREIGEDISGEALPYAGFVRLLAAAPTDGRAGEAAVRLSKALDRFRHARDRVATANLKLVTWIAKRYSRAPLPAMDLVQEGSLGLLKAIEKFDPSRGNRFATYATWWIRQAMTRAIADQGRIIRIPVHGHEALGRLERFDEATRARTGVSATDDEAATALERATSLIVRLREAPMEPVGHDANLDGSHWFPSLGPRAAGHPEYQCLARDRRAGVTRMLGQLNGREERVLRMRFGIAIPSNMTLEEVGALFDVTRERIRQIEAKALRRLAHPLRLRELRQFS